MLPCQRTAARWPAAASTSHKPWWALSLARPLSGGERWLRQLPLGHSMHGVAYPFCYLGNPAVPNRHCWYTAPLALVFTLLTPITSVHSTLFCVCPGLSHFATPPILHASTAVTLHT